MKKLNKVELELESNWVEDNGVSTYVPGAFIKIETENDELLEQIISALTHVEALEV